MGRMGHYLARSMRVKRIMEHEGRVLFLLRAWLAPASFIQLPKIAYFHLFCPFKAVCSHSHSIMDQYSKCPSCEHIGAGNGMCNNGHVRRRQCRKVDRAAEKRQLPPISDSCIIQCEGNPTDVRRVRNREAPRRWEARYGLFRSVLCFLICFSCLDMKT